MLQLLGQNPTDAEIKALVEKVDDNSKKSLIESFILNFMIKAGQLRNDAISWNHKGFSRLLKTLELCHHVDATYHTNLSFSIVLESPS